MATSSDPRQMLPREVVLARPNDSNVGFSGKARPLPRKKYTVAYRPATVTCTTFLITREGESKKKKKKKRSEH